MPGAEPRRTEERATSKSSGDRRLSPSRPSARVAYEGGRERGRIERREDCAAGSVWRREKRPVEESEEK